MVKSQPKNLQQIAILLVLFSGFFLVGINKYFSPVYIIFLLSFPIFFANLVKTGKLEKSSLMIILFYILPTLLLLLFHQFYLGLYSIINEIGRHILPFLYLILGIYFMSKVNVKYIAYLFIKFNLYLLIIESIYRFLTVLTTVGFSSDFYEYKLSSLFYQDSNYVAMHILAIYFFIRIYIDYYGSHTYLKVSKSILLILLILTFSRTAYVILSIYYTYVFVSQYKKSNFRFFITVTLMLFSISFISSIVITIVNDGSFITKLHILNVFINTFFTHIDLYTILFGIGSGNGIDFIGRASHNIFGLVLEMGLIWFLLYTTTITYLIKKSGKQGLLFFYPVIISATVSLLPISYMSLYYIGLLLLIQMKEEMIEFQKEY